MDAQFRPIPITILDFMAILIPGSIWLTLFIITSQFVTNGYSYIINSPLASLLEFSSKRNSEVSWLPIILVFALVALLIGYSLKPIAMRSAETISALFFKMHKKYRKIPLAKLRFPFKEIYKETDCYKRTCAFIREGLKCSLDELPGHQPFSAAKRYLRLIAPSLWEESERMEAEVRMAGVLFLASLYSVGLSGIVLFLSWLGKLQETHWWNMWLWFILSVLAMCILAESFNRLRVREVGYTYVNALIAAKYQPISNQTTSEAKEK
jgi:biotin transporter BioY